MKYSILQFIYKIAVVLGILSALMLLDLLIIGQLPVLGAMVLLPANGIVTDYFIRLSLRRRKTTKRHPLATQAKPGFAPRVVVTSPNPHKAA